MNVTLPDWVPTWSDVTAWWSTLTQDPKRLALLAVIVVVVLVLLRQLLKSWLGRIFVVVAAVVAFMAVTNRLPF
jgi:hypothetical protein